VIILDLETTGVNYKRDKIIDVAALKVRGWKILDTFETLVNPLAPIPAKVTSLTGINQSTVKGAPTFREIQEDLYKFMRGHRIYGYNVAFDKRFLVKQSGKFLSFIYEDYLKSVKKKRPEYDTYKMEVVAKRLGILVRGSHRASNDVLTLFEIIKRLGC